MIPIKKMRREYYEFMNYNDLEKKWSETKPDMYEIHTRVDFTSIGIIWCLEMYIYDENEKS